VEASQDDAATPTPPSAPVPGRPASPGSVSALFPVLAFVAGRVAWVAGLALTLSAFMGWYSGTSVEGPVLSVLGWNTGTIGKLVFVLGLAVILLALRGQVGVELPRSLPESVILIVLGTTATTLVLIRVISIPDQLAGTSNRGVGLWVALASAITVLVAGFLRATEEL
jgi:hypothetical protein